MRGPRTLPHGIPLKRLLGAAIFVGGAERGDEFIVKVSWRQHIMPHRFQARHVFDEFVNFGFREVIKLKGEFFPVGKLLCHIDLQWQATNPVGGGRLACRLSYALDERQDCIRKHQVLFLLLVCE